MLITSDLFEAYLKCPTKCFLRSLGETGTNNSYANWVRTQYLSYSSEGIKQLVNDFAEDEVITGTVDSEETRSPKWRLSIQTLARTHNRESIIHAVERLTSERGDKPESLIPIRFINTNRVHKHDKLSLAFDALALSQMLGREISVGNIISGDNHARLTVNPGALASEVNAVTEKIDTLLSRDSPPELILNRHCPECGLNTSVGKKRLRSTSSAYSQASPRLNAIAIGARGYSPLSSFPTRSDRAARAKGQRILQCRTTSRCRRSPSERTLSISTGPQVFRLSTRK
jgi:CRISPR/Cas system-associated exonuclease Cas4 (RecB family)